MSEISFPPTETHLFESDIIEFPPIVDGKAIKCRITLDEIIREFKRGTSPKSLEEHFLMLRPQIEERAKRQILEMAGP